MNTPDKSADYRIGEDLYGVSLVELEQRIEAYQAEIARLRAELARKGEERSAADKLFG